MVSWAPKLGVSSRILSVARWCPWKGKARRVPSSPKDRVSVVSVFGIAICGLGYILHAWVLGPPGNVPVSAHVRVAARSDCFRYCRGRFEHPLHSSPVLLHLQIPNAATLQPTPYRLSKDCFIVGPQVHCLSADTLQVVLRLVVRTVTTCRSQGGHCLAA